MCKFCDLFPSLDQDDVRVLAVAVEEDRFADGRDVEALRLGRRFQVRQLAQVPCRHVEGPKVLASGRLRRLTNLRPEFRMRSFDVSPDGKTILFDRYRENSDIVLIDLPPR